jgi:membrane protease YdiL (CAAX protease family)
VPVSIAWSMVFLAVFTAGLLRRFHDEIPESPFMHPIIGNLLFGLIFVLLLVASRERSRGAVPGSGIRLGSITPLLLMLLIEKWISLGLYEPLFAFFSPHNLSAAMDDALFRIVAGVGLLLTCWLLSRLSTPTRRKTARRLAFNRLRLATLQWVMIVAGTYLGLGALAAALGNPLQLRWPKAGNLLLWVLVGQIIVALAEEIYYRGLLYCEIERLAPRMGFKAAPAKRWVAIGLTSMLFSMEHISLAGSWDVILRQLLFTASLGALFALLVAISANLYLAVGVHMWINWLLLGAAPHFADQAGRSALPAGTYIGLTLALSFIVAFLFRKHQPIRLPAAHERPHPRPERSQTLDQA